MKIQEVNYVRGSQNPSKSSAVISNYTRGPILDGAYWTYRQEAIG